MININQTLVHTEGGLRVVCVGSVFKSWHHLKEGFFAGLAGKVEEMTLLRLTKTSAVGCAYLAAKNCGIELPIDFKSNYEVFCHFKCLNCDNMKVSNVTNNKSKIHRKISSGAYPPPPISLTDSME